MVFCLQRTSQTLVQQIRNSPHDQASNRPWHPAIHSLECPPHPCTQLPRPYQGPRRRRKVQKDPRRRPCRPRLGLPQHSCQRVAAVAEFFTGAVAVGAFWLSTCGRPKLIDWPLRVFSLILMLTLAGTLL